MSVKMPCAVRRLIPYPHCIMTKDNSLAVKRHFCEIVEPRKLMNQFTRVFVVISGNPKYLLAANLLSKFRSSRFRPHTKIPQEVQNVIRFYASVQAFNNRMIHLLNGLKKEIIQKSLGRMTINPSLCHGRASVRVTRVLVSVIVDNVAAGVPHEEVLQSYPALTRPDIDAALAYAAELTREGTVDLPLEIKA